jgi:glycosyltransferase involved in cell wall biosynthesis
LTNGNRRATRPLVSAIVAIYKAERFLRGCLDDLERQTIANRLEIIVVNTGSPQNEDVIVGEYSKRYGNIVYIKTKERETLYSAWNRGVRASRGKYITNANADDRHRRDAFEVMVSALDRNRSVSLVYADCLITRNENERFETAHPTGIYRWQEFSRDALLKGCFVGPQPMWRRDVHKEHGYFDDSFVSAGDYEFWLRISRTRKFLHLPETLGLYLESPASVEHSNAVRAIHEAVDARRRHSTRARRASTPKTENPRRVRGVKIVRFADGFQVHDRANNQVHYLNQTAVLVLQLCNGKRSARDIAQLLASQFELRRPPLNEVKQLLSTMEDKGVVG